MEYYELKVIESISVLVLYLVLKFLIQKSTAKVATKFSYQRSRVKIVNRLINVSLFLISAGMLLFIWGVKQSELLFFISSLLTILGIAFFAQWSIISNITSSLILFFNHVTKIGDEIKVLDKEFEIEGTIHDIGFFFIIIKTKEDQKISIPNNVFINKMVQRISEN